MHESCNYRLLYSRIYFRGGGRAGRVNEKAMTLLELTIVVVIMSIMMIFAIPNMRGFNEKNKLITSTRKIISLVRYARAESITGEREIEIRIDIKKQRYRLDLNKLNKRILGSADRKAQRREQFEHIQYLPRNITFKEVVTEDDPLGQEKIVRIIFYPDGSATGTTIVLENKVPRKGAKIRHMIIEIAHSTALPEVFNMTPEKYKQEIDRREQEEEQIPEEESEFGDFDKFLKEYER
jgi:Tfp pilus assembly protein FimT